jgi:type IV pilus assembly protein PilA
VENVQQIEWDSIARFRTRSLPTRKKGGALVRRVPKQNGFSLIELLIVVAIILIIAAIAIPNLMRARMSANDSSAMASVRTINTAEIAYRDTYPTIGFTALASLGGTTPCTPSMTTGCLVDNLLATAVSGTSGKSGYYFSATPSASPSSLYNDQFYSTGTPLSVQFGTRSYCAGEDAVIRLQPPGNITLVTSRAACFLLSASNN